MLKVNPLLKGKHEGSESVELVLSQTSRTVADSSAEGTQPVLGGWRGFVGVFETKTAIESITSVLFLLSFLSLHSNSIQRINIRHTHSIYHDCIWTGNTM